MYTFLAISVITCVILFYSNFFFFCQFVGDNIYTILQPQMKKRKFGFVIFLIPAIYKINQSYFLFVIALEILIYLACYFNGGTKLEKLMLNSDIIGSF